MRNRQKADISVVVATYNGELFLEKQLQSILNQTILPSEIIICDDCSNDETIKILDELRNKNNLIKVFLNKENIGFQKNFIKAIEKSTCNYIALSDQDDIWTSNHLELLYNVLLENDTDLACGVSIQCDEEDRLISKPSFSKIRVDSLKNMQFENLIHGNFVQGSACMFKRKLFNAACPFPDSNYVFHDYWLALNAVMNNGLSFIHEPILYYRCHGSSITNSGSMDLFSKYKRKINNFFKPEHLEPIKRTYYTLLYFKDKYNFPNDYSKKLDDVIMFFESLVNGKRRLYCLRYYFSNMRKISKDVNCLGGIIRAVKWFVFCWNN